MVKVFDAVYMFPDVLFNVKVVITLKPKILNTENLSNLKCLKILDYCAPSYIEGLSILGGEPFCNLSITLQLVEAFRQRFGHTKTIWVWTGFLFEYLKQQNDARKSLLEHIDVLVDGPFILEEKDLSLLFRGSRNQRVIDMKKTLKENKIILSKFNK